MWDFWRWRIGSGWLQAVSSFAGAVFDILAGLEALREGVSPRLPSSGPPLEVEEQVPLHVPGHRIAAVS